MSHMVTVFSPAGEQFEVTRANGRDLTSHAGWTYEPTAAPVPLKEFTDGKEASTVPAEEGGPEGPQGEDASGEGREEDSTTVHEEEVTAEFFEGMDKEAVTAIAKEQYPDLAIDGRWNLEKLVAKVVEFANAA